MSKLFAEEMPGKMCSKDARRLTGRTEDKSGIEQVWLSVDEIAEGSTRLVKSRCEVDSQSHIADDQFA